MPNPSPKAQDQCSGSVAATKFGAKGEVAWQRVLPALLRSRKVDRLVLKTMAKQSPKAQEVWRQSRSYLATR
jgi:hypothetical protein